ncbi:FimV/HubP family polar landmark protein [Luminiphilus sp. nBUS_07]|uniref:FimV/HubP family polar landmark protein n=1 Tax=Luminiphilus sp. nBUS_07 TaxID=3395314 RepID=UPI003EBAB120
MGKYGITGGLTLWRYVILLAVLSPSGAWALGLGDITLKSYLNEPLSAEVTLLDVQDLTADDIRVRLGTQSAFDRLGIDRAYFLTNIKFEVLVDDSAARIILTSTKPLLEPYLDFLVETRWPDGRLLREYTVLVDLPIDSTSSAQSRGFSATASTEEQDRAALDATISQLAASAPSEDMSDREFARDTQAGPSVGGRYLVQHADTLWEIALEAVPQGATVEQTMLATVQMNSDAFLGGNINGLKAGYVLEMPSEGDILTSQNEALLAVDQANQDWRDGIRRTPALRVVADVATEDESIADDPFEAAFAPSEEDRATSSELDESSNLAVGSDSQPNPVAEIPKAVEASNAVGQSSVGGSEAGPNASELLEIQARLTALSEQMGNLRNLVVLKDQQIAALEAQLAAQRESTVADANADVKDTASARTFAPINRGFPWWAFALGGVALLGIGAVVYSRRVQQPVMILKRNLPTEREPSVSRPKELDPRPAAAPAPAPAPSQAAAPVQAQAGVENTATQPTSDGERGYGQRLHNDYVDESVVTDAIAEADIYMAYGRHQQALNLLESAAQANPEDSRALLKMVEIYLKNDRQEEAKSTAQKLKGMGNGHAFGEASRMLSEVIPAASNLDLGELAEPVSDAPLTLDLEEEVLDEIMPYADPVPRDSDDSTDLKSSDSATSGTTETGAASDTLSYLSDDPFAQQNAALPPELAEVLGSDVPPPLAEADKEPEGLVYAAEVDPVDTQLDLARAYIDMGDEDGARPVLKEVIAAGDLRQQAEARELLINID